MNCLKPLRLYVPDYDTEGNGYIVVPCGKCEVCRNNDAICWRVRLKEEFYNSYNAYFVTLTYSDDKISFNSKLYNDKLEIYPAVNKADVQKFFKRFRKRFEQYYKETDRKLSYFLVSEYGPNTLRPHYHAILFNVPILSKISEIQDFKITQVLHEIWNNGHITCDKCNENRIAYCTKYLCCQTILPKYYDKPFRLMSKGLGKCYLDNVKRIIWHKSGLNNYYPDGSFKLKLPRYLKDKIFSDDEKDIIRQLYILNHPQETQQDFYNKSKREIQNEAERIKSYKRSYASKNIKKRKDI